MDAQIERQARLQRSIERTLENFKKTGRKNVTPAIIRSRIAHVKEAWAQYQQGHDALMTLVSAVTRPTVDYFAANLLDVTEAAFLFTMDELTEWLESLEPVVSPNNQSVVNDSTRSDTSPFSLSHLPPIRLPPFDGKHEEWEHFRDRFTALIRDNTELSDFARMHYLTSSLKGCALECIANLAVTADNFEIAWQTLQRRFENKRRLLATHMSSLLNLPAVTRESASELHSLHDKIKITLSSLKRLNRQDDELWNDFLVHIVVQKLDPVTRKAWTLKAGDSDVIPQYDVLESFLTSRVRAIEELAPDSARKSGSKPTSRVSSSTASASSNDWDICPLCETRHYLSKCPEFRSKNPSQRREIVKKYKRCFNCLSANHSFAECRSTNTCRSCHQKHHSMLHQNSNSCSESASPTNSDAAKSTATAAEITTLIASADERLRSKVLLATARIRVRVSSGRSAVVRALIDQGSEMTFISERLAQLLRVKKLRLPISVSALGGISAGTFRHAVHLQVTPCQSDDPTYETTAVILPRMLTSYAPTDQFRLASYDHLSQLPLADRDPTSSKPIDVLIGADLYSDILREGVRRGKPGQPIAQNTVFGWIISGPVDSPKRSQISNSTVSVGHTFAHHVVSSESLDREIRRFWETEDAPSQQIASALDAQCENHFLATHNRDAEGRYIVRLPFRHGPPIQIGHSRSRAEQCLQSVVRKLSRNAELKSEYSEFMTEYETLGHMRVAPLPSESNDQVVYIPHHAVVRESSSTTRLRVVFNASSVTSNGSSVNDHLCAGPKLQTDLPSVITRWRRYKYVYCADIAKMYRQIRIHEDDVDYQRIIWLDVHSQPRDFQLLTVTYGMACSPFIALRVIRQLTRDDGHRFPLAVPVLTDNIYVDDVLFGDDDQHGLRQLRSQVISLLKRGGFTLRKWASNSSDLLVDIDNTDHGLACSKDLASDERIKILGIGWNPSADVFEFRVALPGTVPRTKRHILSSIAKLFDPLGWVTPVIISAKIFMQQIWQTQLDWDEPISVSLLTKWNSIYSTLDSLNGLTIDRWTGLTNNIRHAELHGFSDASSVAYAAAVYLKTVNDDGEARVTLIVGKSKVAPLKPMTIPRLELSAAVLLAKLIPFARQHLGINNLSCHCWTDSTVTLAWISQHPSRWRTFVANRVADIQEKLVNCDWHYVPTDCNPADCASRGLLANEIEHHTLWWHGPPWLMLSADHWPAQPPQLKPEYPLEEKRVALLCAPLQEHWNLDRLYSSWPKLLRVTAYIMRFTERCRNSGRPRDRTHSLSLALSSSEISLARIFWLKRMQAENFPTELNALLTNQPLPTKSPLLALTPFLDQDGLLRVGGRLRKAPIAFSRRHPILLSAHPLVDLIIHHTHLRTLHAGLTLTLAVLRRDFWVLRARNAVKAIIHKSIECTRERAAIPTQLMGDLPEPRVTPPKRSFLHCGIDYAGPMLVRASAGRGITSRKAYVAVFICLATKAIHLELVGDYSTPAFIGAFARFCARRGLPESMYSDNGTTFTGADKELTRAYRQAVNDPNFLNQTASDRIQWKFIPPSAPHFGGLWESGVKSVKHHLRRILHRYTLTFEELTTVLCNVEACLNSRPLAALTDNIDDYDSLTPGHFLVGSALTTHPEPSLLDLNENRLSRWQLVRHVYERFWRLWQSDFINTLQQRAKWRKITPAIPVGQLVLLRNDSLPPCKWELGRVVQCHAGADGLVRVVTIRTATSEYRRPIAKICVLPIKIEHPDN